MSHRMRGLSMGDDEEELQFQFEEQEWQRGPLVAAAVRPDNPQAHVLCQPVVGSQGELHPRRGGPARDRKRRLTDYGADVDVDLSASNASVCKRPRSDRAMLGSLPASVAHEGDLVCDQLFGFSATGAFAAAATASSMALSPARFGVAWAGESTGHDARPAVPPPEFGSPTPVWDGQAWGQSPRAHAGTRSLHSSPARSLCVGSGVPHAGGDCPHAGGASPGISLMHQALLSPKLNCPGAPRTRDSHARSRLGTPAAAATAKSLLFADAAPAAAARLRNAAVTTPAAAAVRRTRTAGAQLSCVRPQPVTAAKLASAAFPLTPCAPFRSPGAATVPVVPSSTPYPTPSALSAALLALTTGQPHSAARVPVSPPRAVPHGMVGPVSPLHEGMRRISLM